MKIVFLDSSTVDCGQVDLSPLDALGELVLHPVTAPSEVVERCREADVVITNKVVIDREVMEACPELRYVIVAATGTNNVDLEAAADRGLPVSNVSGYSTPGVVQHVFASILSLATGMHRFAGEADQWAESPIFTRLDIPVFELAGKTLGVVGLGSIGSEVARIGEAFGMKVIALGREGATESSYPRVERDAFFSQSDFVTLHCPLTSENENFINSETLSLLKPGAFLINTGRGPLVDEVALIDALESGHLGGAAVDVLSVEPPSADHPFLAAADRFPNLIITPHTAWASLESRRRLMETVTAHVEHFGANGEARERVA